VAFQRELRNVNRLAIALDASFIFLTVGVSLAFGCVINLADSLNTLFIGVTIGDGPTLNLIRSRTETVDADFLSGTRPARASTPVVSAVLANTERLTFAFMVFAHLGISALPTGLTAHFVAALPSL
jgi:hypothetical protein